MKSANCRAEALEAKQALATAEAKLAHVEPDLDDRDSQISQQKHQIAVLLTEKAELEEKQLEATSDIDAAEAAHKRAETQNRGYRSQIELLEEELNASRNLHNALRDEHDALRQRHDEVCAQLSAAQQSVATAGSQLRDLETVQTLASKLKTASDETRDEFKRELRIAHEDLTAARLDLSLAQDRAAAAERELKLVETAYGEQTDKLAQAELHSRASAAELLRANERAAAAEDELDRRDNVALERVRAKDREIHVLRNKVLEIEAKCERLNEDLLEAAVSGASTAPMFSGTRTLGTSAVVGNRTEALGQVQEDTPVVTDIEIDSLRNEIRDVSRKRDELKSDLLLEQNKRAAVEKTSEDRRVEIAQSAIKIKALQQELSFANEALEENRAAICARDKAAASAQQGFAESTRRIRAAAEKDVRAMEESVRSEKGKVRKLQTLLSEHKQSREAATQQLNELQNELKSLKEELAQGHSAHAALKDEHQGKVNEHLDQVAHLSARLHEKTSAHDEAETNLNALQDALSARTKEVEALQAELDAAKAQSSSKEAAGKEDMKRILDMMQAANDKSSDLQAKLEEANAENAQLQGELNRVAASSRKVAVQLEQSRRDGEQLNRKTKGSVVVDTLALLCSWSFLEL